MFEQVTSLFFEQLAWVQFIAWAYACHCYRRDNGNRSLIAVGVSGDGDTGSIGLGQFKHMVRRNVPIVYIVEK